MLEERAGSIFLVEVGDVRAKWEEHILYSCVVIIDLVVLEGKTKSDNHLENIQSFSKKCDFLVDSGPKPV